MKETNSQIVELFEQQAKKCKDRIAVKSLNKELSYEDLNKYANALAWTIRNKQQSFIQSEPDEQSKRRAALVFEHDIDMIVGILGILKSGNTYVSLDPNYPRQRLTYILQDCEIRLLITNGRNLSLAQKLIAEEESKIEIINLDNIDCNELTNNAEIAIDPQQYAYIMYTSGSTGKPKGVIQTHQNIVHFIRAYSASLEIDSFDNVLLLTSYSHTVSAIDIFSALLNGAGLYVYDIKTEVNMMKLPKWISEEGITVYHSVPTTYRYLLEAGVDKDELSKVRLVILGGEEVFKQDVELYRRYFSEECTFVNLFGSSELLIASLYKIDRQTEVEKDIVPIGRQIEGVEIFLLDEEDEKVGVFGIGELVYQSDYLSPGYLNIDDKKQDVFVKNPLDGKGIVYRSGDLGRKLLDGNIEYLGRQDFQIKIRGYRVELGEVETALDHIEDIRKSVVSAFKKKNGENYLVAYYTTKSGNRLEIDGLVKNLSQKLPDYMLPTQFVFLEKLPLTLNGKIDRKSLLEPGGNEGIKIEYAPPTNEIEEELVGLWQEILQKEKIGINDNFFQLGGHSLSAITLINKIYQSFDVELSLGDFMENQTIGKIAGIIQNLEQQKDKLEEILYDIEETVD